MCSSGGLYLCGRFNSKQLFALSSETTSLCVVRGIWKHNHMIVHAISKVGANHETTLDTRRDRSSMTLKWHFACLDKKPLRVTSGSRSPVLIEKRISFPFIVFSPIVFPDMISWLSNNNNGKNVAIWIPFAWVNTQSKLCLNW
jgi:hypothetical protein